MCGIFGYLGNNPSAAALVIEGLKKLEYRGYDSWGVAYKTSQGIETIKQVGKISEFDTTQLKKDGQQASIGETHESGHQIAIAHTRWATHGGVTQLNAHPHSSENGEITVVHNGIFENYVEVKEELIKDGFTFISDTDTEVVPHLISKYMKDGADFQEAVKLSVAKLEGRYGILAICKSEDKLIAARRGSPLIVGINEEQGEYFIASDIPAFLQYTKKVMYLDDNQMVVASKGSCKFYDLLSGEQIEKRIIEIDWNIEDATKGDYPHFMIKEISEQKVTLEKAINQNEEVIVQVAEAIQNAYGTFLVGCGTAGKVCMVAEYLFASIAKRHVNVCYGSEFQYFKDFIKEGSLLICVSQSGETADTIEAIEVAKAKGAKIISIVNVESSTMARISDIVVPIKAGPEKAVASTKATTSQLAIVTLIAYATDNRLKEGKQLLINTSSQINDMLNPRYEDYIHVLAERIKDVESMYIIGKGKNYPIALEAAIKIQEVSYIHAEGFAGGELKHGPIALISQNTPCIVIVANDEAKKDILSNAMEVKARGGYIIGVSPENNEIFDYWLRVPDADLASPIVNIIPIQILAYQLAVLRQNNPDMPRNLAKSVTVK